MPDYVNGSVRLATDMLGPSLHHQKKPYAARYGDEVTLIQVADGLVRLVLRSREAGEYLDAKEIGDLCRAMWHEIREKRQLTHRNR